MKKQAVLFMLLSILLTSCTENGTGIIEGTEKTSLEADLVTEEILNDPDLKSLLTSY